jgi:hypothetical protein
MDGPMLGLLCAQPRQKRLQIGEVSEGSATGEHPLSKRFPVR